jgi:Crp-like helix-turn-helix domain
VTARREVDAPVGRAARALITASTRDERLGIGGLRVVLVVIELTAAYGKLTDQVSRSVIAEHANVTERTVTRTLQRLADQGLIRWAPARARGQLGVLELVEQPDDNILERETPRSPASPVDNDRTRDTQMSHVPHRTRDTEAPNARHGGTERETPRCPTTGFTEKPPSTRVRAREATSTTFATGNTDDDKASHAVIEELGRDLEAVLVNRPGPGKCQDIVRSLIADGYSPETIGQQIFEARRHGDVRGPKWLEREVRKQPPRRAPTRAADPACHACDGNGWVDRTTDLGGYSRCDCVNPAAYEHALAQAQR